ncbi:UNVERIFIED_CONTAM: Agamous-like MADS-box protein [Sesamum radiatum]|uniref:Agamous-like MADS-box protein n=1 Tax=Sesamum radiatum TaxID=300843 RepID=A0AAW2VT63_SESRA
MGRSKLPIKKIENTTNRQVTFSKRRYGLIKKAYEIAVLCDIDLALIMFSPSGRLSHFSGRKRVEDVIYRYINLSDRDRGGPATPGSDIEEIQKQILDLQHQLERDEEQLRVFEPNSEKFTSLDEFQSCEVRLTEALRRVTQRKRILLSKVEQQSSYQDTIQQINTVVQYITEAQVLAGAQPSLENEEDHGIEIGTGDNMNIGSEASSVSIRERSSPTVFESVSQTSGNENVQSADGYQSSNIKDDGFQQYLSSKDLFSALLPPESSNSLHKGVMESSIGGALTTLDQQTLVLESHCHQLPSSELHL